MRRLFFGAVLAIAISSAATAKPMVSKIMDGPPQLVIMASKTIAQLQTCLIARQPGSTVIALPDGGQRVMLPRGIGMADLTEASDQTKIEVRAYWLNRAAAMHWARGCTE